MDIENGMATIENSLAAMKSCRSIRQKAVGGLLTRVEASNAKPTLSYADMLKKLRTTAKPEESDTEIESIRKTRDGSIQFELDTGSIGSTRLREELRNILGKNTGIRGLEPKMKLELRNLDWCTTKKKSGKCSKISIEGR